MAGHAYSPEEITARGEAIYREQIRNLMETTEKGKFVIIDIETGDYEVDSRDVTATVIQQLGLVLLGRRSATLAHGESVVLNAYLGTVSWHGLPSQVGILQTDEEPLLGMSRPQESGVTLEVWDDGGVVIEDPRRSGEIP